MHVIFIVVGMRTNLWTASSKFQLHILEDTAHKALKLGLHILQSTYITMVEQNRIPSIHYYARFLHIGSHITS